MFSFLTLLPFHSSFILSVSPTTFHPIPLISLVLSSSRFVFSFVFFISFTLLWFEFLPFPHHHFIRSIFFFIFSIPSVYFPSFSIPFLSLPFPSLPFPSFSLPCHYIAFLSPVFTFHIFVFPSFPFRFLPFVCLWFSFTFLSPIGLMWTTNTERCRETAFPQRNEYFQVKCKWFIRLQSKEKVCSS